MCTATESCGIMLSVKLQKVNLFHISFNSHLFVCSLHFSTLSLLYKSVMYASSALHHFSADLVSKVHISKVYYVYQKLMLDYYLNSATIEPYCNLVVKITAAVHQI